MMQQALSYVIFIYFVPLVFIGAFFLLNLTLAVINSKFTEAHKEQQVQDQALAQDKLKGDVVDDDMESALHKKDEMSIAQFITARIYAKKMIEFLRMRQEIKKIEAQRFKRLQEQHKKVMKKKRTIPDKKKPGSLTINSESQPEGSRYMAQHDHLLDDHHHGRNSLRPNGGINGINGIHGISPINHQNGNGTGDHVAIIPEEEGEHEEEQRENEV